MRTTITRKMLAALTPKPKPYELRDAKLPGLIVRVQPSGAISFIAQLDRAKRVTLGRYPSCTLDRARKTTLAALNAFEEGATTTEVRQLVRPKSEQAVTLRSFLSDRYRHWLEQNRKTGQAEAARLVSAFGTLLDRPMEDITSGTVERWRTERLNGGLRPASINRDLNTLKACLRRAVEWGALKSYSLGSVKAMRVDSRGVVRFLSNDEESALRAALEARELRIASRRVSGNEWRGSRGLELRPDVDGDHLRPMVLISLNTGLRRGELFALRWRDLDPARRVLTVRGEGAKAGNTRHIPLTDEALEVFEAWRRERITDADLVFPGRTGRVFTTLKTAWSNLLADAGIENFRWHDLRHTFASKLVQAGVDLNAVRELMGHADIKMTLRYAHLAPNHLADAIRKLTPAVRRK